MFTSALQKIFGSKNERVVKSLIPIVEKINRLEESYEALSDGALQAKTAEFRGRLDNGASLDDILPEAFAAVREASKRTLGMRHFDVQLIGGMVLHSGKIAEMKTGEGKTLVATLPAYLNSLTGQGVHVVTVNDYLAKRDAEWMSKIYNFLGLQVGVIVNGLDHAERKVAYGADITYGQNNEYGFDYLRDNMKVELNEMVQRAHVFAIVDEVDSILVDEARTPLIISGPSEDATDKYKIADEAVRRLRGEEHYTIDQKTKGVTLTDEGVATLEEMLGVKNLYEPTNIQIVHHLNQSLKAHTTMKRDVDYVVRNGHIVIVDEFTGRLMPGRRWSDGLHQAIEAKERVQVQRENQTLATITFQNYFRMYKKLSGMTGTADTEAVELKKIYNLDVVVIPTNRPMVRQDYADVVYASESAKFKAVCEEIEELTKRGQPVLVGTASIAKSEKLSEILSQLNVKHHVLNAKQHEREAEIVAQAGRLGSVTISTNMAGRGTDIVLGGNPEFLAAAEAGVKDPEDPNYQSALAKYREACAEERKRVVEAGGLHILGTERHESRRIDNQLRGRSGRQGDPGSSRFYVSLEDDLMKRFGGERMKAIMARVGLKDEDAIEGRIVANAIERAQKKVEAYHFEIRKHLLDYDNVLNKQREVIYTLRDKVLRSEGIDEQLKDTVGDVIEDIVLTRANEKEMPVKWNINGMFEEFQKVFGFKIDGSAFLEEAENAGMGLAQELFDALKQAALEHYEKRKEQFGEEIVLKLERILYLEAIDFFWKEHLTNIDYLKEGIGLRGYSQKDPLLEYQQEAFHLFSAMIMNVKAAVLQKVFSFQLVTQEELAEIEAREREMQHQREASAQTIHEEMALPAQAQNAPGENEAAEAAVGNREQRRQLPRVPEQIVHQISPGERHKKEQARKKNREAKKARKRGR